MNILYYCDRNISPLMGGTERITLSVSNSLRSIYGIKCHLAYKEECIGFEPAYFDGRIQLTKGTPKEKVTDYIKHNEITHIIIQNAFDIAIYFRSILDVDSSVKIVLCYHFAPGWDTHFDIKTQVRKVWRLPGTKNKLLAIAKYFYFHAIIPYRNIKYRKLYNDSYNAADQVVLLSDKFIDGYVKFGRLKSREKLCGIPNMLSFRQYLSPDDICKKEKIVLIVARLDEEQKRISYALKIWKKIKEDARSLGWTLYIIGEGDNKDDYKKYVSKNGINDIKFLGRQHPEPFYKKASIFMLTSRSEGWGLTLTESQQFGVVPLAFNSYESLQDIIASGSNGFIIEDKNINEYSERLLTLMADDVLRYKLADNAINSAHRFDSNIIAERWVEVLQHIER